MIIYLRFIKKKNETKAAKTWFIIYLRKKIVWCLDMDLIKNILCNYENELDGIIE